MKQSTIYLTCALCHHFDGNQETCSLYNRPTFSVNQAYAEDCQQAGTFMREFTVQYSISNYYKQGEMIPNTFIEDLNHLPKDRNGVPLYVLTKRGIERAIPAYNGLELTSDPLLGVKRCFTYQGQRELIYELGVDLAERVCKAEGVNLIVLPSEEGAQGHDEFKHFLKIYHRGEEFGSPELNE